MRTLEANVDNKNITAEEFREFVRNTLSIVEYERLEKVDVKQGR